MAFSHPFGAYSVEGTLNNWFATNLTASGQPAWMTSARVVFDYPETPLFSGYSGHAFSVTHLPGGAIEQFQGRNTVGGSAGALMGGTMDISCWVDKRQAGASYSQHLRQMSDMVRYLGTCVKSVQMTNVYTGASGPTAIDGLIRLDAPEDTPVANPDPQNPDVFRRRTLLRYSWTERV